MEFTKLSTKGQVVIPQEIRQELSLEEGTPFAVIVQNNGILLKRIEMPKVKSWRKATRTFVEAAKKSSLSESDIEILIESARRVKK